MARRSASKEEQYRKDQGACGVDCLKGVLIAFNFIFVLGGVCALGIGIWTVMSKMQYVALLGSVYYNLTVYMLMGAGVLVLLTGVVGCMGAMQKNNTLLTAYFILLLVIFLSELVAGVMAFVYRDAIKTELANDLKSNLNKNYNQTGEESLTQAVDDMQQNFKCCGVQTYADWRDSTFVKQNKRGLKTPESCCKTPGPDCSVRDHPSNIYRVLGSDNMGCLLKLETYLKDHLLILAIAGIAVATLEILVMALSCCLKRRIVDEEQDPY